MPGPTVKAAAPIAAAFFASAADVWTGTCEKSWPNRWPRSARTAASWRSPGEAAAVGGVLFRARRGAGTAAIGRPVMADRAGSIVIALPRSGDANQLRDAAGLPVPILSQPFPIRHLRRQFAAPLPPSRRFGLD